ncbi:MAG TPA: hypothetical protein VGZ22_31910 [Isosphaeraceae bacterium]|nr:hypothetical protein [Isosphaeraceae bacterium]
MRTPSAIAQFEATEDRRAIVTPALRLVFRWTEDRWTHEIQVRRDDGWFTLAESIEADRDRDDPARVVSPAYQQFHHQQDDAGIQAMLLGQSGPHHFSAVFSVKEVEDGTEVCVDLADRCRAEIEALACTYQVRATSSELAEADPERVVWRPEWAQAHDDLQRSQATHPERPSGGWSPPGAPDGAKAYSLGREPQDCEETAHPSLHRAGSGSSSAAPDGAKAYSLGREPQDQESAPDPHALPPQTLTLLALPPARIFLAEAGRRGTSVQVLAGLIGGQHTQRCRYRWLWTHGTLESKESCS